jgi:hypothetical protein
VKIRTHREYAPVARISIDIVVHLGFVQVTNTQHFLHQRHCIRNVRRGNPIRDLELFDRLRHLTLVGVELPLGHVDPHHVNRLRRLVAERAPFVRRVHQRVQLLQER